MSEYTEQLENYNQAVREANRRENSGRSFVEVLANMPPGKKTLFKWLQEEINEEFNAIQKYLKGEIPELKIIRGKGDMAWESHLTYFQFPREFDEYIASLVEKHKEDFEPEDFAWITNTKKLIQKYHAMCEWEDL